MLLVIFEFHFSKGIGESENAQVGQDCKTYLESRLRFLESNLQGGEGGAPTKKAYAKASSKSRGDDYNTESDFTLGTLPKLQQSFVPANT